MAKVKTYNLNDEKKINDLMVKLSISRDEAIDIVNADKEIDKGADLFELTAEQKKVEKKMRNSAGKKVDAYGKTTERKRKEDADKRKLIEIIKESLAQMDVNADVTNPERQLDFVYNDRNFRIVLSAPRGSKKE